MGDYGISLHLVADIYCECCDTYLGWKYEEAYEPSQKYKEGKAVVFGPISSVLGRSRIFVNRTGMKELSSALYALDLGDEPLRMHFTFQPLVIEASA
ncbi:hypothetical protein TSMEX_003416 [Taenia solium]|eukprot:TsM_000598300 transcript=TsM_000598300 gene=TsM_000598300